MARLAWVRLVDVVGDCDQPPPQWGHMVEDVQHAILYGESSDDERGQPFAESNDDERGHPSQSRATMRATRRGVERPWLNFNGLKYVWCSLVLIACGLLIVRGRSFASCGYDVSRVGHRERCLHRARREQSHLSDEDGHCSATLAQIFCCCVFRIQHVLLLCASLFAIAWLGRPM